MTIPNMIIIHNDIAWKRNTSWRIYMAALQKWLKNKIKKDNISWIRFSNRKRCVKDAINWIWGIGGNGKDIIIECEKEAVLYIVGPNILFEQGKPMYEHEKIAANSKYCVGYFYHSDWYGELVKGYLGEDVKGEMYKFYYPVHPIPKMFKEIKYNLLIYLKHGEEARKILKEFKDTDFYSQLRAIEFHYGSYKKKDLYKAARISKVCLYLGFGEPGGLATEEIMLCGCPIVSMERDSPLGINNKTVNWISEKRSIPEIIKAIDDCKTYDRLEVRDTALSIFSIDACGNSLLNHLKHINGLVN